MSIAGQLEENLKRLKLRPEYWGRLVPATDSQMQLTKKWILPNVPVILADMYLIRREVDAVLSKDPAVIERVADYDAKYPYGLCMPIRDLIYKYLLERLEKPERAGIRALRSFVDEGGIIQKFWGIDKGVYFQNAIQIGDTVLDAANDTVNINKDSVILYPSTAESAIRRVESFEEYADVAEKYWHSISYPNIYLPALAPVFPVITVKPVKKGRHVLVLETDAADLHFKNLMSEYRGAMLGLAARFLFESAYAARRLPESVLELLFKSEVLKRAPVSGARYFRLAESPDEARGEFERFRLKTPGKLQPEQIRDADTVRLAGEGLAMKPLAQWNA